MAVYGYIRVSTSNKNQTTDNQRKVIVDAGFAITAWFDEVGMSGTVDAHSRPQFKALVDILKEGDTVVTTAIDRLGRSASDVLNTVEFFKKINVKLRVMTLDAVDLTSSTGKLLVTLLAGVAEMERDLLVDRVCQGLARTVEQGTILGAPNKLSPEQLEDVISSVTAGQTREQVAEKYGITVKTVGRYLKKFRENKLTDYSDLYSMKTVQHEINRNRKIKRESENE